MGHGSDTPTWMLILVFGQIMRFENFVIFWGGGVAVVPAPIRVVSASIGQLGLLMSQVLVTPPGFNGLNF